MRTPKFFQKTILAIAFVLCFTLVSAQDKNEAKVDSYIAKAEAETDVAKKNELYNKAAEIISMSVSSRLDAESGHGMYYQRRKADKHKPEHS